MKINSIKDIKNLKDKKVFLRCDFNISLSNGQIANDTRIVEALPTIDYLCKKGARIIVASHLGRPKGQVDERFTLTPVAQRLEKLTGKKVHLIPNFWEKESLEVLAKVPNGEIALLENIRYYKGEEENELEFAKHLASMADIYVNDAFGVSHRVHSSTIGITEFLPSYAGLLMDKEISMLSQALENPKRPFLLLIGGAKTPEKISVIERLLDVADTIALGGAIANTFLAAWGFGMGKSLVDHEMIEMSRVVFWKAARKHCALILPTDVVIHDAQKDIMSEVKYNEVPHDVSIYDIGKETCAHYGQLIKEAKTVIWNGPMGFYEEPKYKKGTDCLLKHLTQADNFSIVGGGDTLTTLKDPNYIKKISHISTGGSAMLAYMEKGTLPGIEVLRK